MYFKESAIDDQFPFNPSNGDGSMTAHDGSHSLIGFPLASVGFSSQHCTELTHTLI
jgi:hypothetical protein